MVKKKTTKEIRAIDRIIKFQVDDGIESLTIGGKEALADLETDNKNNVTLYLNADKDKINEIQSLVPFVTLQTVQGGTETDKTKTVTLSQDLTQFALEIADNSKELASIIKTEFNIVLDLDGLVQQLLEIAGKMAELEAKNLEQDVRLTTIEEKDLEQDGRLTELENNIATVEENQEIQSGTLKNHSDRITVLESVKPSEGSFVGYAKLFKELGEFNTSFIFEEIPIESVIFLSIFYECDGLHHVFTRNWFVHQEDRLQVFIENAFVNIDYNGVDTLTVAFDYQTLGFATVDVVSIRKEGLTNTLAHVDTEEPIIPN